MERSSLVGSEVQVDEEGDFNLREWGLRARRISRENTTLSRRFSASNLKSFREEARSSFPSNVTVSSTASSPGYTAREEIDPSTYSFTTALRALQAKTVYTWELQGGMILNSKWNEAEKYISNPLSGQVPLECLSAKTLSGRSFRGLNTRITMSAPLIYPSHFHPNPQINEHLSHIITSNEKKTEKKRAGKTRDVGTQSTPVDLSSRSPSPVPTPSIQERSINMPEAEDSSVSLKSMDTEVETNETGERESIERKGGVRKQEEEEEEMSRGGCLSLRNLWMRKTQSQKQKHKTDNTNSHRLSLPFFTISMAAPKNIK